ncbi:hypothetical protein [Ewingella americana]|uniref:Uncharacterized protein n=1 Tax=Ewingella americana TaxID=41202 RepID=A0A502GDW0_9GAMM|nr:hypothetical protein [Ewingella americana]TPG60095.1 hypothetical protein EAH77_16130 [Ewingella americana]
MLNHINAQVELFRTAKVSGLPLEDSYFLKRVGLGDGTSGVAIATGADNEEVVGIAHIRAIAKRFGTVVEEQHVVASDKTITLSRVGAVADSIKVFNVTSNKKVDAPTLIGNVVSAAADLADKDVVTVTYRYAMSMLEVQKSGLPIDFANQVTGNDGSVEFATGRVSVETDLFDTEAEYTVSAPIYVAADGTPTTIKRGSPVARVVSEPTALNPVLGISGFFIW